MQKKHTNTNKIKLMIALGASFTLAITSVQAALFQDDFESWTIDSEPGVDWTVKGEDVTITSDQSVIGETGDSQGVRLQDNDSTPAWPKLNQDFTDQTGDLYAQFDYKRTAAYTANSAFRFRSSNQTGDGPSIYMTGGSGQPAYHDGSGFQNLDADLDADSWYRFTIATADVTATNPTFDLRIQSLADKSRDVTFADLDFPDSPTELSLAEFYWNNSGTSSSYYIDNVLVSNDSNDLNYSVIPEPSTLALLGLISALGFAGRRRSS